MPAAVVILKSREDKKPKRSGQEARSLQQAAGGSGVEDHGCGRVGGDFLKAEGRGKQHVALSALTGDWRLAINTESNR